jgi:hypothetical protein
MAEFKVGDKVRCHVPDSWVDGKTGTIIELNVSRSGDEGHCLQMEGGITIVSPEELELLGDRSRSL